MLHTLGAAENSLSSELRPGSHAVKWVLRTCFQEGNRNRVQILLLCVLEARLAV